MAITVPRAPHQQRLSTHVAPVRLTTPGAGRNSHERRTPAQRHNQCDGSGVIHSGGTPPTTEMETQSDNNDKPTMEGQGRSENMTMQ